MKTDNDKITAVQNVVDRVESYQESAPEGTVEKELREGLSEAGLTLEDAEIASIVEAIEAQDGPVSVAGLLS